MARVEEFYELASVIHREGCTVCDPGISLKPGKRWAGLHGVSVVEVPIEPALFYQKYKWWQPIKKYRQRKYLKSLLQVLDIKGEL